MKKSNKTIKSYKVPLDIEARMRILANAIIDRVLEDHEHGSLKFSQKTDTLNIGQNSGFIEHSFALPS